MRYVKWAAVAGALLLFIVYPIEGAATGALRKTSSMMVLALLGLAIRAIFRVIFRVIQDKINVLEHKALHAGEEEIETAKTQN